VIGIFRFCFIGVLALLVLSGGRAQAQMAFTLFQAVPHDICDREALRAARNHGVPPDILRTITRLETGRTRDGRYMPWPWTVNHKGQGSWYTSRAEAQRFLEALAHSGERNFDIGCFQVNYRWHGEHFGSISDMLDPRKNADYAARFLLSLKDEQGSWRRAVASYHSRTARYAKRYSARFDRILRDLDDVPRTSSPPSDPMTGSAAPFLSLGQGARPLF